MHSVMDNNTIDERLLHELLNSSNIKISGPNYYQPYQPSHGHMGSNWNEGYATPEWSGYSNGFSNDWYHPVSVDHGSPSLYSSIDSESTKDLSSEMSSSQVDTF